MAQIKRWLDFALHTDLFRPVRDSYSPRRSLPLHSHEYVEITWIDRGRARHQINGRTFTVEPGSLFFIRAPDLHSLTPLGNETLELTNVAIQMRAYLALQRRYTEEVDWAFLPKESLGRALTLDAIQRRRFNHWTDELFDSNRSSALAIDRFLLNLLSDLIPRREPPLPVAAPDWLIHAWREIEKPEFMTKGVTAFFRLAGRSREHTARELQHHFHMTPTECVLQARMKYAARQLEKSTRPILDISLDCGFRDLAHFYKVFRAHYRMTPRAYRLSHRIS